MLLLSVSQKTTRNNILPYKIERNVFFVGVFKCPETLVTCSFRRIKRMKTLSRAGLARVASWGPDRFRRMFMSVMTEFLDVGFTKMKKKVLYDKYISVDALLGSRSNERSLIIVFFSPTFLEYASLAEFQSGSSLERAPSPQRRKALGTTLENI